MVIAFSVNQFYKMATSSLNNVAILGSALFAATSTSS